MDQNIDYEKIEKAAVRRRKIKNILVYSALVLWALIVLFPFYWMILTSIKSYGSYSSEYIPKFFTLEPTIQNYIDVFTAVPLLKYLGNTVIFTLATTAFMLIVITFAAFAFSKLEFRGRDLVFAGFLALMMIPNELVVITNFVTITRLSTSSIYYKLS